jgi:hypothetical protein
MFGNAVAADVLGSITLASYARSASRVSCKTAELNGLKDLHDQIPIFGAKLAR